MTPLKNAEAYFNNLAVNPDRVVVNALEAAEIWKIFKEYPINSAGLERFEYRAFLQAAVSTAVEAGSAMGWIESIFKSAYKPNASAKSIIKKIAKDVLKRYYRIKIKGEDPPIYKNTVNTIAWQCKFYFDSINQGLDIIASSD